VLPLGTAGRLHLSGDIEEALPLYDAKLLDEARPIDPTEYLRVTTTRYREFAEEE
jgi:hypothetical protein